MCHPWRPSPRVERSCQDTAVSGGSRTEEGMYSGTPAMVEFPLEHARPLLDDTSTPRGVVGEQMGQTQPPGQVEGGLNRFSGTGHGLVDAEELHGGPVDLPTDPLLHRNDVGTQGRVA